MRFVLLAVLLYLLSPIVGGRVLAQTPGWQVNPAAFEHSMNVVASVTAGDAPSTGGTDVLAAFAGDEVRGVATPIDVGGRQLFFLTVYGEGAANLSFRFYDAESTSTFDVEDTLPFVPNAILGNVASPHVLSLLVAGGGNDDGDGGDGDGSGSGGGSDGGGSDGTGGSNPVIAPSRASLSAPDSGAVIAVVGAQLVWQRLADADTYEVEVSHDADFRAVAWNAKGLTAPVWSLPQPAEARRYFWRVRGVNSAGAGAWSPVWSFSTEGTTPRVAPEPQTPAFDALAVLPTATLQWSKLDSARRYRLQVAPSQSFGDDLVLDTDTMTVPALTLPGGLLTPGVRYYWRVAAVGSGGVGPWSDPFAFTVLGMPGIPALTSPPPGETGVAQSVTLVWQPTTDAHAYEVQLELTSAELGQAPLVQTDSLSLTVDALRASSAYQWRVRGVNALGTGQWSAAQHFVTTRAAPAVAPGSLRSTSGSNDALLSDSLQWNVDLHADWYVVQICSSPSCGPFDVLLADTTTVATLPLATVDALVSGSDVFWRVQAGNVAGAGPWSQVAAITLAAVPAAPTPGVPVDGALLSPGTTETLRWTAVDASSYDVQVSVTAAFSTIDTAATVADTSFAFAPLDPGRTYYWRVRGRNAAGEGPWSRVARFEVQAAVAVPEPVSPIDADDVTTLTPVLLWSVVPDAAAYDIELSRSAAFRPEERIALYERVEGELLTIPEGILAGSTTYHWRVRALGETSTGTWSAGRSFTTPGTTANDPANPATSFALESVYPNPFHRDVTLVVALDTPARVRLQLYQVDGKAAGDVMEIALGTGRHHVTLDASTLAAGVYLYRMQAGEHVRTGRIVRVR